MAAMSVPGPVMTPMAVAAWFARWELLYRICQLSLVALDRINKKRKAQGDKNGSAGIGQTVRNGLTRSERSTPSSVFSQLRSLFQREIPRDVMVGGPAYFVSTVHALYTCYRGIRHLCALVSASPEEQMLLNYDGMPSHLEGATEEMLFPGVKMELREVERTNVAFLGYLLNDIVHVLSHYPAIGGMDVVAHHLVFASCSVVAGTNQILPLPFSWLIAGESSTIFLNFRWLLRHYGLLSTRLGKMVNISFAIFFFIWRIVIYAMGLVHMYINWSELHPIPAWAKHSVMTQVVGGFALNIIWFKKLLAIATRSAKSM